MYRSSRKGSKRLQKKGAYHKSVKNYKRITYKNRQNGGSKEKDVKKSQGMFAKAVMTCLSRSHNNGDRNGFVAVHATGTGKTLTGAIVVKNMLGIEANVKIILVVPEKLISNWREELTSLYVKINSTTLKFLPHEKFSSFLETENNFNKDTIFIIDEAHLLINEYFRTEEFLEKDTDKMKFSDLNDKQKTLLTLSKKCRGTVLLTATPIVHSILDLRWMYNIARGYDTLIKDDEKTVVPINRLAFCNKFTKVNKKYEIFKRIVDFFNSGGVQSSISRLVMLSQKPSMSPIDNVLLAGNLLSIATGIEGVSTKYQNLEKTNMQTQRVNELVQTTYNNYNMGVMLYKVITSSNNGAKQASTMKPYIYLFGVTLCIYILSNLLSKQLNNIKYPGEKDLFLTREPKGEEIEKALADTFHFYKIPPEDTVKNGYPEEVKIDRIMIDYTTKQRFLFYRFCNGQLTKEDCDLLSIPDDKRVLSTYDSLSKEEMMMYEKEKDNNPSLKKEYDEMIQNRRYRLKSQTLGRTEDQEYYGLKIGNLSLSPNSDSYCVKFEEVFKILESKRDDGKFMGRAGFYSNYSDSIVEFNKFLLLKLAENEDIKENNKKTLSAIFFLDETSTISREEFIECYMEKMCKVYDKSVVVEGYTGSKEDISQKSNILDKTEDINNHYNSIKNLIGKLNSLTVGNMKKLLEQMIDSKSFTDDLIKRLFNNIQRWSLYFLNKKHNIYYLGDVNDPKRILDEFNDNSLGYEGYILLHRKWIEGITLIRVQQFHILEPPIVYADKIQIRGRVARLGTHKDNESNRNNVRICEWFCNDNWLTSLLTEKDVGQSTGNPMKVRKEDTFSNILFREAKFLATNFANPLLGALTIFKKIANYWKNLSQIAPYLKGKALEVTDYYVNPRVAKSDIIPGSLESQVMGRSGGLEFLFHLLEEFENLKKIKTCGENNDTCQFSTYKKVEPNNNCAA
jgi:hypothetical protein